MASFNSRNVYDWARRELSPAHFAQLEKFLKHIRVDDVPYMKERLAYPSTLTDVNIKRIRELMKKYYETQIVPKYLSHILGRKETPESLTYDLVGELDELVDMRQFTKYYAREHTQANNVQSYRMATPNDFVGKVAVVHGANLSRPQSFIVPRDTYLVFTTALGGVGKVEPSLDFLNIMKTQVANDLLYLITYDYSDEYLGDVPYLKDRIIYTPFMKCSDVMISTKEITDIACTEVYDRVGSWGIEFGITPKPNTHIEFDSPHTDDLDVTIVDEIGAIGIYDVPIQAVQSQVITNPTIYRKVTYRDSTGTPQFLYTDKYLSDEPDIVAAHPDIDYAVQPAPGMVLMTDIDGKHITVLANDVGNHPGYRVISRDIQHVCGVQTSTLLPGRTRIIDYTRDMNKTNMLLSELLHKLRAELDESGQYDKKLVVVTPLCRVFHAEATSQPYCLRLENNMMKFLRAIEKFPLEHAFLKKCQENVHKQIQVALNVSLPKRAWAPINTQRTNIRKNILPVEPRKPSKRKQLNVENVIPLENDWRVQKSQKPNTNSATSQRGFLSRFLGK